jgi:hypothetical protein
MEPTAEEIAAEEAAEAARNAAGAEGAEGGPDTEAEAAAALGDKGKQALDRMKAERNAAREQLNAFKNLGLTPEKLQELIGKSTEDAKAADEARTRREAESAALQKANERLIRAEVKAAASGKLANPALAMKLLDLSSFDVDDDGEVDSDAISAAIDDLITKEPYLAVAQGEQKRFQGGADAGARGTAGKPQVTEEQLKSMTPEQIVKAQNEGRLTKLLGG